MSLFEKIQDEWSAFASELSKKGELRNFTNEIESLFRQATNKTELRTKQIEIMKKYAKSLNINCDGFIQYLEERLKQDK